MPVSETIALAYVILAGLAMIMTYREQCRTGHRNLLLRTAGMVACVAWPAVFALIFVAAQRRTA